MLCSRFLKPPRRASAHGACYRATEAAFDGMRDRSTSWTLRVVHAAPLRDAAGLPSVILVATVLPVLDDPERVHSRPRTRGQIQRRTEAAQGISFDAMVRRTSRRGGRSSQRPERRAVHVVADRRRGSPASNHGPHVHRLKPRDQRKLTADQVIEELRAASSAQMPGLRVYLQNPPPIRIGGR